MKFYKGAKTLVITVACITGLNTAVLAAPSYTDVPSSHWAYSSISAIADMGLIVGDTSGNYNPSALISKFDTAKILAKAAGYKYTNISSSEQEYYDSVYNEHKTFLSQFSQKFTKWSAVADREIAFLLDKGIFTTEDLNQFVIKDVDGTERVRALSKEECAVFLVRILDQQTQALTASLKYDFIDDSTIKQEYKPYVYFLKSKGVIAGDSDGNFKPKDGVNKAMMAVMLDKAFNIELDFESDFEILEQGSDYSSNTANSTTPSSSATSNLTSVSGIIEKIHYSVNALQIITSSSQDIYRISGIASIYVDGYLKNINDLEEGMPVIATVNNNELVEIRAQSVAEALPTATPAPTAPTYTPAPESSKITTLEGTVSSVNNGSASKQISIEIKILNPKGDIISSIQTYNAADSCEIIRGDDEIDFDEIVKGDIATVEVSGSLVYSIQLEQKNISIKSGTLVDKKQAVSSSNPILTIEDENGKNYELKVTSKSELSRKSSGVVGWDGLRVGDIVDVTAEYDQIIELYAVGSNSTIEGYVDVIHISRNQSYLTVRDSDNEINTYYIIPGSIDIYSIKTGDKIRVRLDSREISAMAILEQASGSSITGYIKTIKKDSIVLRDISSQYSAYTQSSEVFINSSTVIIDSRTGNKVNISHLEETHKVYIIYTNATSNIAKTITILSE